MAIDLLTVQQVLIFALIVLVVQRVASGHWLTWHLKRWLASRKPPQ